MSGVILENDSSVAIAAIAKQYDPKVPTPIDMSITGDDLVANEKVHYEQEVFEYQMRKREQIRAENNFKQECYKFFDTVIGQLSATLIQRLETTVTNFKTTVVAESSLVGLFKGLDKLVIGDLRDAHPTMTAWKTVFSSITSRQPQQQSLPNFHQDFNSRIALMDPAKPHALDACKVPMSPVLLCAP